LEYGIELALGGEGAVIWQAEQDRWCSKQLKRHWPGAHRYADVRDVPREAACDVLCGGFPCQDVSSAGRRRGLSGPRSGLWSEYVRVIHDLRPTIVFIENVVGLLDYLGGVLGPLAALGYDARWGVFSAGEVGAPHFRERLFIFAYAKGERHEARLREIRASAKVAKSASASALWVHFPRVDLVSGERNTRRWRADLPTVCGGNHGFSCDVDRTRQIAALGNAVVPSCAALAWRSLVET